jgi:phage I-like protein
MRRTTSASSWKGGPQVARPGNEALEGLVAEPPDPAALTDFQEDYMAAREAVLDSMTPAERAEAAKALGM